jgi:hypothetical protein
MFKDARQLSTATLQTDGHPGQNSYALHESIKRPSRTQPRSLLCASAALVGIIVTVSSFYPGYMSTDSLWQLRAARSVSFDDFHPPIMSAVWSILDRIVPGPLGMLVLHNLVFWASLALVVSLTRLGNLAAAALILAVGFFPPNFILLAHIWKDVGMGVTLLSAYALLLLADRRRSRALVIAGLCSLLYPLAVRHNAAFAVLPLSIWGGCIAVRVFRVGVRRPVLGGLGIGVAAFALLLFLAGTTNRILTGGRTTFPIQGILMHDLAGISVRSDVLLVPSYILAEVPTMEIGTLKLIYSPSIDSIFYRKDNLPALFYTSDEQKFYDLVATWKTVIPANLSHYLAHRWDVFRAQMSMGSRNVCYPYSSGIQENEFGLSVLKSPLNVKVMDFINRLQNSLLFRSWLYFILVITLPLGLAMMFRDTAIQTMALGLSGSMYAIPYFFLSQGCDFRYMWWPALATVLVPVAALCKADATHSWWARH